MNPKRYMTKHCPLLAEIIVLLVGRHKSTKVEYSFIIIIIIIIMQNRFHDVWHKFGGPWWQDGLFLSMNYRLLNHNCMI